jgi:hypothetical protein
LDFRRADPRFLLPRHVRSALVVGGGPWQEALEAGGVRTLDRIEPGNQIDLAVAAADELDEALRAGAEMLLVEGRGARRKVAAAGYAATDFLPLPGLEDPALILPLRYRRASAYAVQYWTKPGTALTRLRNDLARALLAAGRFPPVRPLITLGLREPAQPFLIVAARTLGVPADVHWFMISGEGRAFRRGAFLLFPPGSPKPRWAVKFARQPGDSAPFDRDERGLQAAASAGEVVAAHAPQLLGRFEVAGFQASLESAAVGRRLDHVLGAANVSRTRKIALIERIAQWTIDVASGTAARDEAGRWREELAERVAPEGVPSGLGSDLVSRIASVPAVFQHNDLWTWHVIVSGDKFTVIDWEFASRPALPLWDLWYFLFDAATQVDRVGGGEGRERYFVRLFRGEEPLSELLFEWTRRAVQALSLAPEDVGPLATLIWLQYGSFYAERLGEQHLADAAVTPSGRRLPEVWLHEPGLGPGWSVWRS